MSATVALLILLDNCEHLRRRMRAGRAGIASSRAARVRAGIKPRAVACRRRSDLSRFLRCRSPDRATHAEGLSQFESVRLFIDRATAAHPVFRAHRTRMQRRWPTICRRLDGIPLAIELAAACVRSMSVERVATRLSDRFQLLSGGDAYRAAKTADVARADRLELRPARGSGARAAAQARGVRGWMDGRRGRGVGAATTSTPSREVLTVLTRLVEKSLVVLDADGERYRLLDTIREYSRERLDAAGEATTHASASSRTSTSMYAERVFPELVRRARRWTGWRGSIAISTIFSLRTRRVSNVRDGGNLDLRLVHAIKPYYYNRGLLGLALRMTTEALDHPGAAARDFLRCRGLFDAGQLCSFMGRYETAHPLSRGKPRDRARDRRSSARRVRVAAARNGDARPGRCIRPRTAT